jgi:hypothetical protein
MVVTDDSGGCNMVVTDDSGGCNIVATDDSGGCIMVVTDDSGGCNVVVNMKSLVPKVVISRLLLNLQATSSGTSLIVVLTHYIWHLYVIYQILLTQKKNRDTTLPGGVNS